MAPSGKPVDSSSKLCDQHSERLLAMERDMREVRDRLIALETRLDPIARYAEKQLDRATEVFRTYIWPAAMVGLAALLTHLATKGRL